MRKDFYIFRHGETEFNVQHRQQGSGIDMELTAKGKAQALVLAAKLKPYHLETIFSSPLKRALQTAQTAADFCACPVVINDDLRECFYGDAEGMLQSELAVKYPEVYQNWGNPEVWNIAYPNGESKQAALDRVWRQIEKLLQEPCTVCGVAIHGGTMGSLLNYLHYDFAKIENCAVFHLIYNDGKWQIDGDLF